MSNIFEIKIKKENKIIGSCLYYNYSGLDILYEVKNVLNNYNSNLIIHDKDLNVFALRLFQKSDIDGKKFIRSKLPFIKGLSLQKLNKKGITINNGDYNNGIYFSFVKKDKIKNQKEPDKILVIDMDKTDVVNNEEVILEIAKEIYHVGVESTYLNDSVIKIDGGRC